jgi:hypothetical protein
MSGPKCVEIHAQSRVVQRERNRSQCKILNAVYARLADQYRLTLPAMAAVGLDASSMKSTREIEQRVARYLDSDIDSEAVNYLQHEIGNLRELIDVSQNRINETHVQILTRKLLANCTPAQSLSDALKLKLPTKVVAANDHTDLEKLLKNITSLRDTGEWPALMVQVTRIRDETDITRCQMLYENLLIRCSQQLKRLREVECWRNEIDNLIDSTAHLATRAAIGELVDELEAIKRGGQVGPLDSLGLRVKQFVAAEESQIEREKKRQAILRSLNELGYETSENMETALVRGGKLVLRKSDDAEYAVEVAANQDLSLLQTTMVRFADSQDTSEQQRLRDTAREETWCGDHSRLLDAIARKGFNIKFKMKRNAGEVAVRVVIDEPKLEEKRRASATLTERLQTASRRRST